MVSWMISFFFFFNDTATTEIYTLSLHDALPIYRRHAAADERGLVDLGFEHRALEAERSEEHTSELQSRSDLVCRLLLEKKKKMQRNVLMPYTDNTIVSRSSLRRSDRTRKCHRMP